MRHSSENRELGRKPLTLNELSDTAWATIAATFQRMYDNHLFAQDFPTHCEEHAAAVIGRPSPYVGGCCPTTLGLAADVYAGIVELDYRVLECFGETVSGNDGQREG